MKSTRYYFALLFLLVSTASATTSQSDTKDPLVADNLIDETLVNERPANKSLLQDTFAQQRAQYQAAIEALSHKQLSRFRKIKSQLKSYPLYPYLEYKDINRRLSYLPAKRVRSFLADYPNTPLASRLKYRWFKTLARYGQWSTYLNEYDHKSRYAKDPELLCHALWAAHKGGDTEAALQQVEPLWLVGRSQPKACDPIFKLWRDKGNITDALVWQRFTAAMDRRNRVLGRYLVRYMTPALKKRAQLLLEVHYRPQNLAAQARFKPGSDKIEEIVLHGLHRLVRSDAPLAQKLWPKYRNRLTFNSAETDRLERAIVLRLARQGHERLYREALIVYPYAGDTQIVEAGLELALRAQNWESVLVGIEQLPEPSRYSKRWQYWHHRALLALGREPVEGQPSLASLAQYRDYYSFLAADFVDSPYQLNDESAVDNDAFLTTFAEKPGVRRAVELYRLGQSTDARREWNAASRGLSNDEKQQTARYAMKLGWHSQAIKSAIAAERWNDLDARFPNAYQDLINRQAAANDLDSYWVFAVARQESAMTADAVSPKGATGLLQLMPSTAKMVARKHGIKYRSRYDLVKPETNITIATLYLKQMLDKFDNNLIHATAAYNAGPHRVSKWLKENSHMPIDIWIENIPFAETRQYVKNVLAYSVIFATRQQAQGFKMATAPYLIENLRVAKLSEE